MSGRVSVEMEKGRIVAITFTDMNTKSPVLTLLPVIPQLRRVVFERGTILKGTLDSLASVPGLVEVSFDCSEIVRQREFFAALAGPASLRQLVIRGIPVDEDACRDFQRKRPDVDVVLEPAADDEKIGRQDVVRRDGVQ